MNFNRIDDRLSAAMDMVERADKLIALVRKRMQRGYDPADAISCDFEWGSVECHQCDLLPECELWLREQEDETNALLQSAMRCYGEALPIIGEFVRRATLRN